MQQAKDDAMTRRIGEVLTGPVSALGMDLEALDLAPAGAKRLLRVAVDKDGGVTMDDVADATREISRVLDESDVMGERAYTLEVTSRGVDRPLELPRHWRRNTDRLVRVTPTEGEPFTGRVTAAADEADGAATLDVGGETREVAYADVARAVVQVEFNRKDAAPASAEEDD